MEETLQEIKASFQNLPSHIRDVISHAAWKPRIEELALKYSLTEEQKNALTTEVLLILVAIVPEDELAENIKNELAVSSILAEQLSEEIGERIFSWIQKLYTEKEKSLLTQNTSHSQENTLDIPPPNLPGEVIEEEENEFVAKPTPIQDQVKDFFAPKEVEVPVVAAAPSSFIRPIETPLEEPAPQKPQSFISQKLSQPTAPQKYTADPYREPIE